MRRDLGLAPSLWRGRQAKWIEETFYEIIKIDGLAKSSAWTFCDPIKIAR
jgi:hypothetical protein